MIERKLLVKPGIKVGAGGDGQVFEANGKKLAGVNRCQLKDEILSIKFEGNPLKYATIHEELGMVIHFSRAENFTPLQPCGLQ